MPKNSKVPKNRLLILCAFSQIVTNENQQLSGTISTTTPSTIEPSNNTLPKPSRRESRRRSGDLTSSCVFASADMRPMSSASSSDVIGGGTFSARTPNSRHDSDVSATRNVLRRAAGLFSVGVQRLFFDNFRRKTLILIHSVSLNLITVN